MKIYIIAAVMAFCLAGTVRAETYNIEKDVTADAYSYGEHEDIDASFKENEPPDGYPDLIRVLNLNVRGVSKGQWPDPINDNSRVRWVTQYPEGEGKVKAKIEGRQTIGVVYYVSVLPVGAGNGNGNGETQLLWADVEASLVTGTLVLTDNVADPEVSVGNSGYGAPTLYCRTGEDNKGHVSFRLHDVPEGTYNWVVPNVPNGSGTLEGPDYEDSLAGIGLGRYTLEVAGENDFEREIEFAVVRIVIEHGRNHEETKPLYVCYASEELVDDLKLDLENDAFYCESPEDAEWNLWEIDGEGERTGEALHFGTGITYGFTPAQLEELEPGKYKVTAECPNVHDPGDPDDYGDERDVYVLKTEIYDILDKDGESVWGQTLDVKTRIDYPENPAKILYRIVGTENQLNVTEAQFTIKYDQNNHAHEYFYGAYENIEDEVIREKHEENPVPVGENVNEYEIEWDGRDSETGDDRLLLEGDFVIQGIITIEEIGEEPCETENVVQNIGEPHAGHYCFDWPRSSVREPESLPGNGELKFRSEEPDCNSHDLIHPTLKETYDVDEDGFWWTLTMRFEYRFVPEKWVVYTPSSWRLVKGKKEKILPGESDFTLKVCQDENERGLVNYSGSYPPSPLAFIAKYDEAEDHYNIFRHPNFWNETDYQYTGVSMSANDPTWFSFDGTDDEHIKLKIEEDSAAADGDEVAILIFPAVGGLSGRYNAAQDTKSLVDVELSNFEDEVGHTFDLELHRGYGYRNFWDRVHVFWLNDERAGIRFNADITGATGFNANGYRNKKRDENNGALEEWEEKMALIDMATHANAGLFGWYEAEGAEELYDRDKSKSFRASTLLLDRNLEDVFLFIAKGCLTAEEPDVGMSIPGVLEEAGVDVILSWEDSTHVHHQLYTKKFLEFALELNPQTGDYRTMKEAGKAAEQWMLDPQNCNFPQNYVVDVIVGNKTYRGIADEPEEEKLYPARYGKKRQ